MRPQQLIAFHELVDGEIGLDTGDVLERFDPVIGQRHRPLVGGVVRALQTDHLGASRRPISPVVERTQLFLAGLDQFDRRVPPARFASGHSVLAPQYGSDRGELVCAERVEWISHLITQSHTRRGAQRFPTRLRIQRIQRIQSNSVGFSGPRR
jgi:hypothetical protein